MTAPWPPQPTQIQWRPSAPRWIDQQTAAPASDADPPVWLTQAVYGYWNYLIEAANPIMAVLFIGMLLVLWPVFIFTLLIDAALLIGRLISGQRLHLGLSRRAMVSLLVGVLVTTGLGLAVQASTDGHNARVASEYRSCMGSAADKDVVQFTDADWSRLTGCGGYPDYRY